MKRKSKSYLLCKLAQEIASVKDTMLNADRFMAIIGKYMEIQELTAEIVWESIEKIMVHERSEPWKKTIPSRLMCTSTL